jgi:DNA mismatch repair protein MutL
LRTYLLAQRGETVYIIDKHAAHERILYDQLRENIHADAQLLLEPVTVSLGREEYEALLPVLQELVGLGLEAEEFGGSLLVRAVPMMLSGTEITAALQEIAGGLLSGKQQTEFRRLDWIYHSVACRAAVKAGDRQGPEELAALAERVLSDEKLRQCPHGRPVYITLTKRELEKKFGR